MIGFNRTSMYALLAHMLIRIGETYSLKELWKAQGLAEGYCLCLLNKGISLAEHNRYEALIGAIATEREKELRLRMMV